MAAVGNGDQAPSMPWSYASYPAALPHVIGVSALARDGSVPAFSNRDARFNDIAAPGVEIFSTLPKVLTSQRSTCVFQGYSDCGPAEFKKAEGTSFAAPQVSAAAAPVAQRRPVHGHPARAAPEQVANLLTRSAQDATPVTGCRRCEYDRDRLTGWGRLDVAAAIDALRAGSATSPLDAYEPNDDAGPRAWPLGAGRSHVLASVDYWDDRVDVYRVRAAPRRGAAGERARAGGHRHEPRALEARRAPASARPRADGCSRPGRRVRAPSSRSRYRAPARAGTSCRSRCARKAPARYSLRLERS